MAVRCNSIGDRNLRSQARLAGPLARTGSADTAAGLVPGHDLAPPIGAPADGIALADLLGFAVPADADCVSTAPNGRAGDQDNRLASVNVLRCHIIWRLVAELFAAACERDLPEAAVRRRPRCHKRQIAMYLSHVVLSVPYRTIAKAFGRDRTTVMHACSVVEDRRDDAGYDRFVERCERCIAAVFAPLEHDNAEF